MRSLWWKPYFWKDSFLLTCSKRTKKLLFLKSSLTHRLVENELRIRSALIWWLLLGQRQGTQSCIISRFVFTCNQQLSMTNFTFTTYFKNKTNKKQNIHSHPPTRTQTHSPTHVLFLWWVGAHAQILSATPCTWKLQHVHLRSSSEEMAAIKEHFLRSLSLSHTPRQQSLLREERRDKLSDLGANYLPDRSGVRDCCCSWQGSRMLKTRTTRCLSLLPLSSAATSLVLQPHAPPLITEGLLNMATHFSPSTSTATLSFPFSSIFFFFESLVLLFILYRLFFIWRSYYQDHCSDEVWD